MSTFEMDTAEDMETGGGEYMDAPGRYHFAVNGVFPDKMPNSDDLLKNGGFSIEFVCLAGTDPSQVQKKTNIIFNNGHDSHKDGGKMCRQKQTAFCIAANLLTPSDLGKKGVKIELEKALGAQMVVEMELGDERPNGKRYLELAYSNIYHVDDPRAKDVPKDEAMLKAIPDAYRHVGDQAFFAPLLKKKEASGQAAAPRATDSDFEGL